VGTPFGYLSLSVTYLDECTFQIEDVIQSRDIILDYIPSDDLKTAPISIPSSNFNANSPPGFSTPPLSYGTTPPFPMDFPNQKSPPFSKRESNAIVITAPKDPPLLSTTPPIAKPNVGNSPPNLAGSTNVFSASYSNSFSTSPSRQSALSTKISDSSLLLEPFPNLSSLSSSPSSNDNLLDENTLSLTEAPPFAKTQDRDTEIGTFVRQCVAAPALKLGVDNVPFVSLGDDLDALQLAINGMKMRIK